MKRIITITTDFGDEFALSQLKAVLLSINPDVQIVVISNEISDYSIIEGTFVLSQTYNLFPKGTIHIGVVDPGVGSKRDGVVIESNGHVFIGPNNGLFSKSATDRNRKIYKIIEDKVSKNISTTFHGRDIFAPLAGLLSTGDKLSKYTKILDKKGFKKIDFKTGQILHIDHYGNLKVNFPLNNLGFGDKLKIKLNNSIFVIPFCKTFANVNRYELLAYKGSHDTLEIAQNLGSAQKSLDARLEQVLNIEIVKGKIEDRNLEEFELKYA